MLAANKNIFSQFSKEKFLDIIKKLYTEIETYVYDITKMKIIKYTNIVLKINISRFEVLRTEVLKKLVITKPELALKIIYC